MPPSSSVNLSKIGQIALTVTDLELATAFYKDQLGMTYLFSAPPGLAFFDCSGVRLMLNTPENESQPLSNSVLYFKVDDIQLVYQTLKEQGVLFDDSPHLVAQLSDHELWMAFLRDPDRNLLGLMAELPLT